jgi:hypothetical protein
MSSRMMARRADRLRLVNQRLNEFYGPLYVATVAGNIAYKALLSKQGKTQCHPIRDKDLPEWMLWMKSIFMPLNDVREKIIIENAHLIVEEEMPQCLLDFVTHVVGYKALLLKWAEGDYTDRRSMIGWPPEFDIYVERSYRALKAEQTRLLHNAVWRWWRRIVRRSKLTPHDAESSRLAAPDFGTREPRTPASTGYQLPAASERLFTIHDPRPTLVKPHPSRPLRPRNTLIRNLFSYYQSGIYFPIPSARNCPFPSWGNKH